MKKRFLLPIIAIIIVSLFLSGCQQDNSGKQPEPAIAEANPTQTSTATPIPEPEIVSIQAVKGSVFTVYDNGENDVFGMGLSNDFRDNNGQSTTEYSKDFGEYYEMLIADQESPIEDILDLDLIDKAKNVTKTDTFYDFSDIKTKAVLYSTDDSDDMVYIVFYGPYLSQNKDIRYEVEFNFNAFDGNKIVDIAAGSGFVAGLTESGEVMISYPTGKPWAEEIEVPMFDVSGWSDITQIDAGANHIIGLKSDGTVVATGDNIHGQCNVSTWTDICSVSAGFECFTESSFSVGLKKNGTIITTCEGTEVESFSGALNNASTQFSDIIRLDVSSSTIVGMNKDGELIIFINELPESARYHSNDTRLFLAKIDIEDLVDYDVLGNSVIVLKENGTFDSITGWNAFLYTGKWQGNLKGVVSDEINILAYGEKEVLASYSSILDYEIVPEATATASPKRSEAEDNNELEEDWQKIILAFEKNRNANYLNAKKDYLKKPYADENFKKILFASANHYDWPELLILDSRGVLKQDNTIKDNSTGFFPSDSSGDAEPWEFSCPVPLADFCILPSRWVLALTEQGELVVGTQYRGFSVFESGNVDMSKNAKLIGGQNFAGIYDGDTLTMPEGISMILNPYFYSGNRAEIENYLVLNDINMLSGSKAEEQQQSTSEIAPNQWNTWEEFASHFDGTMPNYAEGLEVNQDVFFDSYNSGDETQISAIFPSSTKEKFEEFCTKTIDSGLELYHESADEGGDGFPDSVLKEYTDSKTGAKLLLSFADFDGFTQISLTYFFEQTDNMSQDSSGASKASEEQISEEISSLEEFIYYFDGEMPDYVNGLTENQDYSIYQRQIGFYKILAVNFLNGTQEQFDELCQLTLNAGYSLKDEEQLDGFLVKSYRSKYEEMLYIGFTLGGTNGKEELFVGYRLDNSLKYNYERE